MFALEWGLFELPVCLPLTLETHGVSQDRWKNAIQSNGVNCLNDSEQKVEGFPRALLSTMSHQWTIESIGMSPPRLAIEVATSLFKSAVAPAWCTTVSAQARAPMPAPLFDG